MPKSIALIACSNGLGHVRRTVLLAEDLSEKGAQVVVFAPLAAVQRIASALNVQIKFKISEFQTHTNAEIFRTGNRIGLDWYKHLPCLDDFDLVVSDNLPEILEVRPDAWLSGNFFWHDALPEISSEYKVRANKIMADSHPRLLTYGPFSFCANTQNVQIVNCSIPIPKYVYKSPINTALLVTCGTGGEAQSQYREFLDELRFEDLQEFSEVFVDPTIIGCESLNGQFARADFSLDMYSRTIAAIGRPGFGLISDSLVNGIRMFSVFEEHNFEMENNARVLVEYGVGSAHANCRNALDYVTKFLDDRELQFQQKKNTELILNQGLPVAADILLSDT